MRFEEYLVDTCAITREQVIKASDIRRRSQPPLGTLALERHLLSRREVDLVLTAQQQRPLLFGELAVDLGLLSSHAVATLLDLQREKTPTFSDVLVSMGAVDEDIYEWVLEWYEHYGTPRAANDNQRTPTVPPESRQPSE